MLLDDFLTSSTSQFAEKTALICGKKICRYSDLLNNSLRLANFLRSETINRHDRVVIFLENSIESAVSIYGILKANAILVIVNPTIKSRKLHHILTDCQASALITDSDGLLLYSEIDNRCPDLKFIMVSDYSITSTNLPVQDSFYFIRLTIPVFSFELSIQSSTITESSRKSIDIDIASLMYTSGSTTGNPKGVTLTHYNMVNAVVSITQYLQNQPDDIILNYLPLSFDYGLYQVLMSVAFGGTVILEKAFVYPYQAVQLIRDHKVTGFPLVPAMAALLLQLKDITTAELQPIRYITNTGQALPPAHIQRLRTMFPQCLIFSMYGLTECKRALYLPPSELDRRPDSVGKAIPNTEVWLVNESGERIDEPDVIGELVIRGSHVMKGYWNCPDATSTVLKQGLFHDEKVLMSGDLFKMDSEGFLYFIARKDDLIKSGGERISPREIENVLHEIPQISEAAVIGVPDPILGNAIKAFVVVKTGSTLDEETILKYCSQHLERSRVPKHIEFADILPRGSTGKVQKRLLKLQ